MFVHLSVHRPKPGKEKHLIDSMHRFGTAMLREPGLQQVHTLMDQKTGALIALALWDSKEEWESARPKMQDAIKNDRSSDWEDNPPEVFYLEPV
jgi:heme-degrading monooxygenase HmoA